MNQNAKKALEEYSSLSAHHGGKDGRPFWNAYASQFMYAPNFEFHIAPGYTKYLFTLKDATGKIHTFEADSPRALLSPVWNDIPEGMVELKVETLDDERPNYLVGARTFYKCAPFPGIDAYPPKARSYKKCALMAYEYVYSQSFIQHWLLHGTPDPEYDFNVYPSKTISAIIRAMIRYAKMDPKNAENALKLATRAADFLISISYKENTPTAYLPPTYYLEFRQNIPGKKLEDFNNEAAVIRFGGIMMIYPPEVGLAYLDLEKATGEVRFYEAARRIADYLKDHVQPSGSWYLQINAETGEPLSPNHCSTQMFLSFMSAMHKRTGEEIWHELEKGCYDHMVKTGLETYNWEGQFEDSQISANYSNLTHYGPHAMMTYILMNKQDDAEAMAEAEDLLRFIEDQFVIWGNFAPWNRHRNPKQGGDISQWYTPAGLEQYGWAMPIDASTSIIMESFLKMYLVKKDPLLLEKACVLGDMVTRMQNPKTGLIPTHWMRNTCIEDGGNLWINCMLATADRMFLISEIMDNLDTMKLEDMECIIL